jgi:hypothetical protein
LPDEVIEAYATTGKFVEHTPSATRKL